jgi:hypothetical protein
MRARHLTGSLPVGAPGFAVVTSVGEAHGRTRDLLNPMPISFADWRSWASLVLTGADAEWDFDEDGIEDPAKLDLTLLRD